MMRPILTREEYLAQRDSETQKMLMRKVRGGDEKMKSALTQMNYSCLPNEDGSLKGSKRMSTTIGMDVDHIAAEEMEQTKQRILEKKDELGLLMLEESARGAGYHLVFRRRPELSQEENLKWASQLLGVQYDEGAKDITRVFFTTTKKELVYLDDSIFEVQETLSNSLCLGGEPSADSNLKSSLNRENLGGSFPSTFKGIPYTSVIAEY